MTNVQSKNNFTLVNINMKHEKLQELTGFQYWLATNYKTLPSDSGEMTKRARDYFKHLNDLKNEI
jgi:hypothetical protein